MKNSRTPRLSDLIRRPASRSEEAPLVAPAPSPPEAAPERVTAERPAATLPPPPSSPASSPSRPLRADPRRIEPSPAETEARVDYQLLEEWIAGIFEQARRGAVDGTDIFDNVQAILDRPHLLDALFAETFKTTRPGDLLTRRSLNVAIYSQRLGRALRYEGPALVELGVAGLLHRIGFARLPESVVLKPGRLSRDERAAIQEAPRNAREIVAALGPPFEKAAEIVGQCFERNDGSGYPLGLQGDEIHPEALVVGLVDMFDALIQPRPYRDRLLPFGAVKEILDRERLRFPRPLLRAFIDSFSVFPPYTYVRLNSKAIARVIETEAGYPLRPRVAIVLDANGQRPSRPQTLRLRESPLLYITGPVSEEELPA